MTALDTTSEVQSDVPLVTAPPFPCEEDELRIACNEATKLRLALESSAIAIGVTNETPIEVPPVAAAPAPREENELRLIYSEETELCIASECGSTTEGSETSQSCSEDILEHLGALVFRACWQPHMLAAIAWLPQSDVLLDRAKRALGLDLREVGRTGRWEHLQAANVLMPANIVASCVGVEILKMKDAECAQQPRAVTGEGMFVLAALHAAGVLGFEDILNLSQLYGESLQTLCEQTPQCSFLIRGLCRATVERMCKEAQMKERKDQRSKAPVCQIYHTYGRKNFRGAGTRAAVTNLVYSALTAKAGAWFSDANIAYNTPLTQAAAARAAGALDVLLPRMKPPACAIYFQSARAKVEAGTPPIKFVDMVKREFSCEIQTEGTYKDMMADDIAHFYVIGPAHDRFVDFIDEDWFDQFAKRAEHVMV